LAAAIISSSVSIREKILPSTFLAIVWDLGVFEALNILNDPSIFSLPQYSRISQNQANENVKNNEAFLLSSYLLSI